MLNTFLIEEDTPLFSNHAEEKGTPKARFFFYISIISVTGVEEVTTDGKASKVVVKGKAADPIKVCERLQKKSGRKVEIISPLPKPAEENKEENKEPKEEEKKEEVSKFALHEIYS